MFMFLHFSLEKDSNKIVFNESAQCSVILPRHPETNELDTHYLTSMLKYYDKDDFKLSEILDAFPILSKTTDHDDKFYFMSIDRLQKFSKGEIRQDKYINSSLKHLYMEYKMFPKKRKEQLLNRCLKNATPVMYTPSSCDNFNCETYDLCKAASYVPTNIYSRMKILKGFIGGALHYYEYSIMFFDIRFIGFDDFNENIIDIKTKDLFDFGALQIEFEEKELILLRDSDLYFETNFKFIDLNRDWLLSLPNNYNERNGTIMMFRNNDIKNAFEDLLSTVFEKHEFRVNEVLKWNRYNHGGIFSTHFDTMFVQKSSEECSLYTLLVYVKVTKENNFIYLGNEELKVELKENTAYIIPHWVKHRVEGRGLREFIKTEIIFKNEHIGVTYDQTLADIFDKSCYYMLQSVRYPELKDFVSNSFNTLNEARFYKTTFSKKLFNHIFIRKQFYLPLTCFNDPSEVFLNEKFSVCFITNGIYYYFKTRKPNNVTEQEATILLSLMYLDIHPKKLLLQDVYKSLCGHQECTEFQCIVSTYDLQEEIFYWSNDDFENNISEKLSFIEFPNKMNNIDTIGNVFVSDIKEKLNYYFAACENLNETDIFFQKRVTEITAKNQSSSLDVEFIGKDMHIIKIRQSSFKNGIKLKKFWSGVPVQDEILRNAQWEDDV